IEVKTLATVRDLNSLARKKTCQDGGTCWGGIECRTLIQIIWDSISIGVVDNYRMTNAWRTRTCVASFNFASSTASIACCYITIIAGFTILDNPVTADW